MANNALAASYGMPTDLQTVLVAIQTRIVNAGIVCGGVAIALPRVLITLAPDDSFAVDPPSDAFILISPTVFPINQGLVAGGGNSQMGTDGIFRIKLNSRYTPGQTYEDAFGLNDETFGLLQAWQQILSALQLFSPLAANSPNSIFEEPGRWIRWTVEPRRPNTEWIAVDSIYQVRYRQLLT